jgi:hypothetical protein
MAKEPEDKAILTVYGHKKLTLNGRSFKEYEHKGGGMLSGYQLKLTLDPGEYTFAGDIMTDTNKVEKNISLTAGLRAGYEYDLGWNSDPDELQAAVAYIDLGKREGYIIVRILE